MNRFNRDEFSMYKKILGFKQPLLLKAMETFLRRYYTQVIATEHFVVAFGDIPIALCAHLDTVFNQPPTNIYYDKEAGIIWSPEGCGHDDRAGVYMIMKIIQKGYRPHIIFTTDEEIGCIGADALCEYENPFKELEYIIQLDRHGIDDCVFYYGNNQDFIKYVESFGFREAKGSFTDIVFLCPTWEVCGVNLSVGYENEHTYVEYLDIGVFYNTMNKVIKMLENPPTVKYEYTEKLTTISKLGLSGCKCEKCGQTVYNPSEDLFPVKFGSTKKNICIECMMAGVNWCLNCNEAFATTLNNPNATYCPDCEGRCKGYIDDGGQG